MAAMTRLTRDQFIPFLDTSGTSGAEWMPTWARVDFSTIFDLAANPKTETKSYICYETDVEEVTGYNPELPQEIALYEGNPVYDFIFDKFYNLPLGAEIYIPLLLCFGGTDKKAWQTQQCTLALGSMNTVEGKLTFTLKIGGDIQKGTYTLLEGVPTFAPAEVA